MAEPALSSAHKKLHKFPNTLAGFNYEFDENGTLCDITTGEKFNFTIKEGDQEYNQAHYEALGEVLDEYVYKLLETDAKLERHYVPINGEDNEPKTFIFMSPGALENPDKLMVLIHGSGVVRAGQWARRLIINDCLNTGTQLPYIKRALQQGYGVIVLNTNDNYIEINEEVKTIRGSESPEAHTLYVYDHFIQHAKAQHLAIVAHSYGGKVTIHLLNKRPNILVKLFAAAFTDSVHSLEMQASTLATINFIKKDGRNWISSNQPLDTIMPSRSTKDCQCVSAGHNKHEMTSSSAINSVFKYLDEKLPYPKHEKMDEL